MTREEAMTFAERWTSAWNDRDIATVLAMFADDVTFTSPTALAFTGAPTVRGKAALREYWSAALGRIDSLRFTLDRVVWDPAARELAILYVSSVNGQSKRASENLTFAANGLVVSAEVFHGVAA